MNAGAYVGRVGGLAVALGIGAAIVTGSAVAAAAEDGAGTGAGATASSADSPSSAGTSSAGAQGSGPAESTGDGDADESQGADDQDSEDAAAGADDAAGDDAQEVADEAADDELSDGHDDAPGAAAEEPAESEPEPAADDQTSLDDQTNLDDETSVDDEQPADQEPADQQPTEEPVPPVTETPVAETPAPGEAVPTETRTPPAAAPKPADIVTVPLPPVAVDTADDAHHPATPALAAVVMSLVGAAREVTGTEQPAGALAATVTAAAEPYPIPTDVTVTEVVAPFQWLQRIPVLGELVVTPVVSFIHRIPLVGEFLHYYLGWPVDHDAPPGTPQPRDVKITSFDGQEIYVHFMPARGLQAGQTAPTVLSGPGLGLPGSTALDVWADTLLPTDVIGVGALRDAGYNVVTWDPRGEWRSEGIMHLDSPDLEGRDVSAIISWVASLPEARLDEGENDPRIGMVGASYGGGIQLATAAIDHRIDAIVPTIAWNSLVDVLFPRGAVNSSWGTLLPSVLLLTAAREHPRILPVAVMGVLFGIAQQSDIDLVNELGYQDQLDDITAPTLLIQGTVDTLFPLSQADAVAKGLTNAEALKVIWYCGGHGTCLSDYNDGKVVIDRTLDWLGHYLKDEKGSTGPQFEWVDQNGDWHSTDTYPAQSEPDPTPLVASSTRRTTLPFLPFLFGSGPNPLILTRGPIGALLGLPSPAKAINAANLHVPDATTLTHVVGAPQLTLTYSGTGNAKHVYAQIVDDATGLVLGNQVTPIPVVLDGTTRTVTIPIEQVAHTLQPGQSVTVQIVTSTVKYLNFYQWGSITVRGMSVALPTLEEDAVLPAPVAVA